MKETEKDTKQIFLHLEVDGRKREENGGPEDIAKHTALRVTSPLFVRVLNTAVP